MCLEGAVTLLWVQISLFAWNSAYRRLAHAVGVPLTLLRCGSLGEEIFSGL